MLRTIFALIAGLFAAMIVITGVELVGQHAFPLPPGLDVHDPDAINAFVGDLPTQARALIVSGWLLGALVGGGVATALTRRHHLLLAALLGAFVALGTIINAMNIHHPAWMLALGAILPIPLAMLAAHTVRKVWPIRDR
jgi:hypothetical protein